MSALAAHPATRLFDGREMHADAALLVQGGVVAGICKAGEIPQGATRAGTVPLIAPGFIDLQVNGGDGILLNDAPDADGLARIARAHLRAGTTGLLPTLVTDTPEVTARAVDAVAAACTAGHPGILGLHLEGPHFSPARKGAHRGDLVRPMGAGDLAFLLEAAARLPLLKVTLSTEAASAQQIAALAQAGVLVSLGHCDESYESCAAGFAAGARCATHLFNAMSQVAGRAPGLVGAALTLPGVHAGIIADGHHVHAANLALAARCLGGDERLFLVSDAMACFGTRADRFQMNGREVRRQGGTLRLADGTLAGADLDLPGAAAKMVELAGVTPEAALAMAGRIPAALIGAVPRGTLAPGARADFLALDEALALQGVWQGGAAVAR